MHPARTKRKVEHQPSLLRSRVQFPAGALANFSVSAKAYFRFPFLLSLPSPSDLLLALKTHSSHLSTTKQKGIQREEEKQSNKDECIVKIIEWHSQSRVLLHEGREQYTQEKAVIVELQQSGASALPETRWQTHHRSAMHIFLSFFLFLSGVGFCHSSSKYYFFHSR